jgi:exodeoxyribonuclease VII large subunit
VQGEVTNCTRAGSGHIYLTLKDDAAQIRAVVWRNTAARLKFELHDGLEVVAAGPIEIYEARGTYQLIVEQLLPQGVGALELAFRQLCEKLSAEGLFAPERKRKLPRFPRRIALVTSPTGAAVRDMLQVITRRWRATDIVIVPVAVQGAGAAGEIAAALRAVHRLPGVDVVITGRGGGSLEDLWAFNEEIVARAIYDCLIPVVSAVGHEIDVTLSDLVADVRALTPSEAAERVIPSADEWKERLTVHRRRLAAVLKARVGAARRQLDQLAAMRVLRNPRLIIDDLTYRIDELDAQASRAICRRVQLLRDKLGGIASRTEALSPLAVLGRGYSVTTDAETDRVITSATDTSVGKRIRTRLKTGSLVSRVEAIEDGNEARLM